MTRKEAQQEAIQMINGYIKKEGENAIAFMAPQLGKNSWSLKELLESAINDTPLEGTKDNIIDDIISMNKWKEEHKK